MELDWLRDFQALAEHANFSRAADVRNVTQPAFSRRIRALETWVGTVLFERGTHGAVLTEAGRAFRPLAEDLLARLERARRDTCAVGERHSGNLTIAATHALSFTFFPGWMRDQIGHGASGSINLISDSMAGCEKIMRAGGAQFLLCHDLAGTAARLDAERFPSLAIGTDTLVPVSAPAAGGRPAWPLPGTARRPTRLLAYGAASGLGRMLAAEPALAQAHVHAEVAFTSHLAATLATLARNGEGAAWLPLTLVEGDLAQKRLVDAAGGRHRLPIEIRLFRSLDCRNDVADALWRRLGGQ